MSRFEDIAQTQIPRILGLANREADSEYYGCFDRYFWHYKLSDFPNARFQESTLALSLAYLNPKLDNFYSNKVLFEWIRSGIMYWTKMQRRNGSFDEAYPHEHSLVATSFSSFSIAKSLRLLNLDEPKVVNSLAQAGDWIDLHEDAGPTNQTIGAACALNEIFQLTNDEKYNLASKRKLDQAMANWQKEGYFLEYGGFDMGYSTIALSYLALLYLDTKNEILRDISQKMIEKIKSTIDENFQWCYQQTSRKTQYIYPLGFKVFGALEMLERFSHSMEKNEIVTPLWMDDRYSIPLTVDYLMLLHL
jgi:hypothetical protein